MFRYLLICLLLTLTACAEAQDSTATPSLASDVAVETPEQPIDPGPSSDGPPWTTDDVLWTLRNADLPFEVLDSGIVGRTPEPGAANTITVLIPGSTGTPGGATGLIFSFASEVEANSANQMAGMEQTPEISSQVKFTHDNLYTHGSPIL